MKLITCLITAAGLLGALLLGAAAPAQAADKCPAEEYLFDSSKSNPPFQCGVHHWSSTKSIASWDTKSWSSDTAIGYSFKSKCKYTSDSDITYTWSDAGPSYTITFTNWNGGTRHFASGVIFATGSVDSSDYSSSNSCANNDGKIKNSLKKITDAKITTIGGNLQFEQPITISGTVSPSDTEGSVGLQVNGEQAMYKGYPVGAAISKGKFTITWMTPFSTKTKTYSLSVAYGGNELNCPKAGSWCGWSPAQSKSLDVTIKGSDPTSTTSSASSASGDDLLLSSNSLTSAASISAARDFDPGVRIVDVSARMPKKLGARCPDGYSPINAELWGGNTNRMLAFGKQGVSLKRGAIPDGRRAGIQLTCRKRGKGLMNRSKVGFGTPKNDHMKTRRTRALLLGGLGDDTLVVTRKGGVANGGFHGDLITLRNAGVGIGGPGDDMLRSLTGKRTLLIGGPGRDLITAGGKARIDARDGEADRIVCRGSRVQVRADSHDELQGRCARA